MFKTKKSRRGALANVSNKSPKLHASLSLGSGTLLLLAFPGKVTLIFHGETVPSGTMRHTQEKNLCFQVFCQFPSLFWTHHHHYHHLFSSAIPPPPPPPPPFPRCFFQTVSKSSQYILIIPHRAIQLTNKVSSSKTNLFLIRGPRGCCCCCCCVCVGGVRASTHALASTHVRARKHARKHARAHARTHAHTHTHT